VEEKIELLEDGFDEKLVAIFSDPNFLLPNLLGAINVDFKENDFRAEIPMSLLFGKGTYVIYGKIMSSLSSVIYVINVAGYGPDKGGKIRIDLQKGKVTISISLSIPIEPINSRVIKSRIKEFKNKANELIRLERIKRKI
jgi:hypothetical protein